MDTDFTMNSIYQKKVGQKNNLRVMKDREFAILCQSQTQGHCSPTERSKVYAVRFLSFDQKVPFCLCIDLSEFI